jgi:hypothetical protein
MDRLFTGRRNFVNALVDVRPRNSLAFAVEVAQHQGYHLLRQLQSRFPSLGSVRKIAKMLRPSFERRSPHG